MAFPNVVGSVATDSDTAQAIPRVVNLPAGIVAGELLEVVIGSDGDGEDITVTTAGWTEVFEVSDEGVTLSIWMKIADGTELGTIEFTITSNECWASSARRIENHGVSSLPGDLTLGTVATGSTGAPNAPNCDPGVVADYLFRAYAVIDDPLPQFHERSD